FVGDGDRHYVQRTDHVGEVLTLATHAQHLDDGGVGSVPTILGTPLGLGNPDGVTGGYRMVDVGRQGLVHRQLLPAPGHRAVHDETLVQPHQDRKSTRLNSSHVKISYAV